MVLQTAPPRAWLIELPSSVTLKEVRGSWNGKTGVVRGETGEGGGVAGRVQGLEESGQP